MSEVVFKYKPREGLCGPGVPPRARTHAAVDTAGALLWARGVGTGLYIPAKPKPETKAEKAAREKAEAARLAAENGDTAPDGGAPSGGDGDDDSGDAGEGEKTE